MKNRSRQILFTFIVLLIAGLWLTSDTSIAKQEPIKSIEKSGSVQKDVGVEPAEHTTDQGIKDIEIGVIVNCTVGPYVVHFEHQQDGDLLVSGDKEPRPLIVHYENGAYNGKYPKPEVKWMVLPHFGNGWGIRYMPDQQIWKIDRIGVCKEPKK